MKQNENNLEKEIKAYIIENEKFFNDFIPKEKMYSENTYMKFQNKNYEKITPKDYFNSNDWISFIKKTYFDGLNSKNQKEEMLFNVSEHLDRELELFGVFDLCDEILSGFSINDNEENFDIYEFFNKFKIDFYKKYDEKLDFEDFKEEMTNQLANFITRNDNSKIEDLYKDMDIYISISPLDKPDFNEESYMFYSEDYDSLLYTEENIEILSDLNLSKKDIIAFYGEDKLKKIDNGLLEIDLLTSDMIPFSADNKIPIISFEKLVNSVIENGSSIPFVVIKKNISELLYNDNYLNKKEKTINLNDSVLCLSGKNSIKILGHVNIEKKVRIHDLFLDYANNIKEPTSLELKKIYESNVLKNEINLKNKVSSLSAKM